MNINMNNKFIFFGVILFLLFLVSQYFLFTEISKKDISLKRTLTDFQLTKQKLSDFEFQIRQAEERLTNDEIVSYLKINNLTYEIDRQILISFNNENELNSFLNFIKLKPIQIKYLELTVEDTLKLKIEIY
ncbi:MAG: hypothetical protein CMN01_05155 [Rickettsiales bacterium]|nr:hypothetical protein [Rickettsiales bacterium]|tara:strand:- start:164 stop:556 length:393 start_codon:yes stop_codon:yes gene_type:complete